MDRQTAVPHDIGLEAAVLGSILLNNDLMTRAKRLVAIADFYDSLHQRVWLTLNALSADECALDYATLLSRLGEVLEDERLRVIGLADGVPRSENIDDYCSELAELTRRRRLIERANEVITTVSHGGCDEDVAAQVESLRPLARPRLTEIPSVSLFSDQLVGKRPEFFVPSFFRRAGLHVVWAAPGTCKTYGMLYWLLQMLEGSPSTHLSDHPELAIFRKWRRALWVGTEEEAETLQWKGQRVARGLGYTPRPGSIEHVWAVNRKRRVCLDDLEELLDTKGPFDVAVMDSLTGLRPRNRNGQSVEWDRDNDAMNELCLNLRGIAHDRDIVVVLIHHTGVADKQRYRGGIELQASADVEIGLVAMKDSEDMVTVMLPKVKDGKVLAQFRARKEFTDSAGSESFKLTFDGMVTGQDQADKVLKYVNYSGVTSQVNIVLGTGLGKAAVRSYLTEFVREGKLFAAGKGEKNSPLYGPTHDKGGKE